MKHKLAIVGLLLLFFYYAYPQAIAFRGSVFTFYTGIISIGLYAYHRFPFKQEVVTVLLGFAAIIFACYLSAVGNGFKFLAEPWPMSYIRSQMGWFFTAYMINGILFRIHKKPTVFILFGYIVGAVALQCFISVVVHFNDTIKDFLFAYQHTAVYDEKTIKTTEQQRLIGYGTGFFGAGMVAGYALIFLSYIIMRMKVSKRDFILLLALYCFIFFIGLFNARTTTVGLAFSLIYIAALYIMDHKGEKKRMKLLVIAGVVLFIAGYTLCAEYFPEYADWAFELFNNLSNSGEIHTDSSEGLLLNLFLPEGLKGKLIGTGNATFFMVDIGFTRMAFYFGIIGIFFYFFYGFIILRQCATKDWSLNLLYLIFIAYVLAINIKGWTDLNPVLYLLFFFFVFYKHEIFIPKVEMLQRQAEREKKLQRKAQNEQ